MLLALALGISLPAAAQQRPTIAIMPAQYFSADEQSAEQVTQALAQEFERQGYHVVPLEQAREAFQAMGLGRSQDIGDKTILAFGRRVRAGLVAHPQLMAVGIPAAAGSDLAGNYTPAAVLYLRVMNVPRKAAIYTRQIGYEFQAERPLGSEFTLPQTIASAAATQVTSRYFERVAGSRQEYRRGR
jgi:hypothetical protein